MLNREQAPQTRQSSPAGKVQEHCQVIASFTDDPPHITRTFLSPAMASCHAYLTPWMQALGMDVHVDAAGNIRGLYAGTDPSAKHILIGSHLDSVPNAGAYDGVLGVVLAISLVEALAGERLPFGIEVIGFSEEEGVRFGFPFVGSRALIADLDPHALQTKDKTGTTVEQAIQHFGLDPKRLPEAELTSSVAAYLEFHIEQGPVLESISAPLAVVERIAGQSRAKVTFHGKANHAGTTPMQLRSDALCAAAEWITSVEATARTTDHLVATVGRIEASPGASNVIPGNVTASLDVRHAIDSERKSALANMLQAGQIIADKRSLQFAFEILLDQPAVPMHRELTDIAERAIRACGTAPHRVASGAGHDAMILARRLPCSMIFLRSPGGISHHPDETALDEDIELALRAGLNFLQELSTCPLLT